MEVVCIKSPEGGWCKAGDTEIHAASRYRLVQPRLVAGGFAGRDPALSRTQPACPGRAGVLAHGIGAIAEQRQQRALDDQRGGELTDRLR